MSTRGNFSAPIHELQQTVRNLVFLSDLPAAWANSTPERIAESLAEALLAQLSLDLVYIRLPRADEAGGGAVVRSRDRAIASADLPHLAELLRPLAESPAAPAAEAISDPSGDGELRVVVAPLGTDGRFGALVAASRRAGFPSEAERLVLSIGANQAALALERKEFERSLREPQEWLRVTLVSIGDAVITTNLRGQITFLNPVAQQLTGWSPEEALGQPLERVFRICHERTRRRTENPAAKALRQRRAVALANHTILISRDGSERPIDDSAAPILDSGGEVIGSILVFRDITERYRAEQEARRREQRLREETHIVEVINEVGQSLAAELNLEKLVQAITDAGTQLTGAEFGAFFYNVLDEHGESYMLYTLSGVPRSAFERFPLPRNTAIFDPTFRGEGTVRLADVTQDPRYGKSAPYYGMPEGHLPVRSYLAVPVISRSGEVIGGLFFGHSAPGVFTERAEQIVVGIAAQAAVAIDNARLYQQATQEIAERRRAEKLLTTQKALLERVARGAALPEVLRSLVQMIEEQSDGTVCSILLLEADGRLRHGAAPSLPPGYIAAIDGLRIGPAVGSCGTAAFRKEPVEVSDIAVDPLWERYRHLALPHGLRACWSTPIHSTRGEVLGTVAMYYREPRSPSNSDRELTEIATHLAGIAIERARTEEALRQSETLLRTIINTEPECVKLVDREGTLRLMNSAGLQMIEAESLESVLGTCVYGLIAPEYRDAFKELNRRVFAGESGTLQFKLIGLQGTHRWMDTHAVPLRDEHGEITAHLAVTRDITERKRDEEALRQRTDELAQRDREKDEFLAMLAHELRNPPAPVLNAIQVLQATGTTDTTIQRQRSIIDRQARHMARLLDDLLDVSRITQGKIELRKQTVDLGALVGQAVETLRPELEQRKHELRLLSTPEALPLYADPARIYQIVSNLLTNAAKYTPPGGRITVQTERAGGFARLTVSDTGQGLDPELLPRVFDLFVQGDRSVSRADSGLGVGLTMVQRLVWLHGGDVEARSDGTGRGSEFVVTLPIVSEPAAAPDPDDPADPAAEGGAVRRILIVDDNSDAAETLADLLSLWGYEAEAVFDGPTGIQVAQSQRPDAILLDISMPGMSGYDVARELRKLPVLAGVLLVALTGYGQEEDRRRSREAGFDHHLTKPVDPDALRSILEGPRPG